MLNLELYQGIIFDMDGTLLDTMPNHVLAWEMTAAEFNFPFDRQWLHSLGGMPSVKIVDEVAKRYEIELDPLEVSQFKMDTFANLPLTGKPIEHTFEVFKQYKGIKPMSIGTGSQRDSAIKLLTHAGVLDDLHSVVSATDVDSHKPNPETFLLAAKKMGVEAKQCIVFEDTQLGLQAAHAGGMDCYLVTESGFEFHPANSH